MHIIPRHVGLIMDGNGRWATERGLPRLEGHRRGARTVDAVLKWARNRGIQWLSLYAFSTENWKRPKEEVDHLMALFAFYLRWKLHKLKAGEIRLMVSGDREGLPPSLLRLIEMTEHETRNNTRLMLNTCLNYGGREDILQAVRKCVAHSTSNAQVPLDITEQMIGRFLYNPDMPDLDLVIRTSGEERLSNFMMWQAAHAEFMTMKAHWPALSTHELEAALAQYAAVMSERQRAQELPRPAHLTA